MDVQVPRKPKKLVDKPANRKGKRKPHLKMTVLRKRRYIPLNSVPSVINMEDPKLLTILGIVEIIRNTGPLKRH